MSEQTIVSLYVKCLACREMIYPVSRDTVAETIAEIEVIINQHDLTCPLTLAERRYDVSMRWEE